MPKYNLIDFYKNINLEMWYNPGHKSFIKFKTILLYLFFSEKTSWLNISIFSIDLQNIIYYLIKTEYIFILFSLIERLLNFNILNMFKDFIQIDIVNQYCQVGFLMNFFWLFWDTILYIYTFWMNLWSWYEGLFYSIEKYFMKYSYRAFSDFIFSYLEWLILIILYLNFDKKFKKWLRIYGWTTFNPKVPPSLDVEIGTWALDELSLGGKRNLKNSKYQEEAADSFFYSEDSEWSSFYEDFWEDNNDHYQLSIERGDGPGIDSNVNEYNEDPSKLNYNIYQHKFFYPIDNWKNDLLLGDINEDYWYSKKNFWFEYQLEKLNESLYSDYLDIDYDFEVENFDDIFEQEDYNWYYWLLMWDLYMPHNINNNLDLQYYEKEGSIWGHENNIESGAYKDFDENDDILEHKKLWNSNENLEIDRVHTNTISKGWNPDDLEHIWDESYSNEDVMEVGTNYDNLSNYIIENPKPIYRENTDVDIIEGLREEYDFVEEIGSEHLADLMGGKVNDDLWMQGGLLSVNDGYLRNLDYNAADADFPIVENYEDDQKKLWIKFNKKIMSKYLDVMSFKNFEKKKIL